MILMKKYLKKILYKNEYSSIVPINDNFKKRKISEIIGGKLNPDKVFYIIRRYPGTGLLSNLAYVINHIQIANRMGFIPIVDMKNYPSVYNENDKIFGTLNSWEYYFEQLTDYSLDEVYQSKNIIITDNKFYRDEEFKNKITTSDNLVTLLKKKIKLKKTKYKTINYLRRKLFKGEKILGVHHRGTGYKITEYPITINQMINIINEILKKDKYDKIFLVTEDSVNFKALKKYYALPICKNSLDETKDTFSPKCRIDPSKKSGFTYEELLGKSFNWELDQAKKVKTKEYSKSEMKKKYKKFFKKSLKTKMNNNKYYENYSSCVAYKKRSPELFEAEYD